MFRTIASDRDYFNSRGQIFSSLRKEIDAYEADEKFISNFDELNWWLSVAVEFADCAEGIVIDLGTKNLAT